MQPLPAKGISGTTSVIPLIGHPVVQVKSPPVQNTYFDEAGLDVVMAPMDIPPSSSLSDWIQRLGPAARFGWFGRVASACRLPEGLAGAAFGACHVRIDLNFPFTPRT